MFWLWFSILIFVNSNTVIGQYSLFNNYVWETPLNCNSSEFYNSAVHSCQMCAEDYRPNSLHLACICKNGFFESQTQNNSDSLCLQCGQGNKITYTVQYFFFFIGEVSSEDGQFCVKCLDENGVQKTSQNGECNCNTNSITTVNYVTQNGSTKLQAKCSACPVNTLADENNGKCVKCTGYECYCGNVRQQNLVFYLDLKSFRYLTIATPALQ